MKVFKELEIAVPESRRADFISRLEKVLPKGWKRDQEAESRSPGLGKDIFTYFVCEASGERQSALVALVPRDKNTLYVSNIVPCELSELTHDQYNRILDEFATACVVPVASQMGLDNKVSSDQATLRTWACQETVDKFHKFSALANKSTGTSHPSDKERWYEFVISVVRNKDRLDATTLRRWLVQEDGWSKDIAVEMAIEFEQEVGLLEYYTQK